MKFVDWVVKIVALPLAMCDQFSSFLWSTDYRESCGLLGSCSWLDYEMIPYKRTSSSISIAHVYFLVPAIYPFHSFVHHDWLLVCLPLCLVGVYDALSSTGMCSVYACVFSHAS